MRVIFRMSAIVAALAVGTAGLLGGCGQRGALYLPTVPPLPAKPLYQQPASNTQPDTDTAASASRAVGTVPDTSGEPLPLTLSPDDELRTLPASGSAPTPQQPALSTIPVQ
ncbi:lipoprotein [Paraburkholderia bonniea]|uniref:LPS translocon maturation chaperone LptM n=1 Tax=Paraburkholderia bonniea TaxID=2152891 RepID=UPI0012928740|nr:lipoprotein [Paraburkholderia bonniea]WJF90578.1 lipoprotein [Paraburkholderia bonniea]WJF93893.1 lipoprotein [Paraburkholderia bonniea]